MRQIYQIAAVATCKMKVFYLILDILQRSKDVYFLILQVIIDPMVHYLNIQDIMNWNAVDALLFDLSEVFLFKLSLFFQCSFDLHCKIVEIDRLYDEVHGRYLIPG